MPSLNRPNAPERLPSSDFGNLFSRPRALRASDSASPNTPPSPLTFSTNYLGARPRRRRTFNRTSELANSNPSSPLASPVIITAQRRPHPPERRSHNSEISDRLGNAREILSSAGPPPEADEEEPFALRHRSCSALSAKARKVLGISDSHVGPGASNDEAPPHEPRNGFAWQRGFLGGWLEIRVGRRADEQPRTVSDETIPNLSHATTMGIPSTQTMTRVQTAGDHHQSNAGSGQPLLEESFENFGSTVSTPKEGLYCRTKRTLGLKRDSNDLVDIEHRSRSLTGHVLDRVSSTLKDVAMKRIMASSANTSASDLSIAAPRRHRFRPASIYSTTSSIREMMMGKPPLATPDSEEMYTVANPQQHFTVALGESDNPSFLPSEARRIHTPPLPDGSPGKSKHRGFFFDYNAPMTEESPRHHTTRAGTSGRTGSVSDMEWYRRKLDSVDAGTNSWEEYVASVPDHLPSSPLCPKHPKHKSRGAGTCPYHGKNKVSPPEIKTPTPGDDDSSMSQNWW